MSKPEVIIDGEKLLKIIENVEGEMKRLRELCAKDVQQRKPLSYKEEVVGSFSEASKGDRLVLTFTAEEWVTLSRSRPIAWLKGKLDGIEAPYTIDNEKHLEVETEAKHRGTVLNWVAWAFHASSQPRGQ